MDDERAADASRRVEPAADNGRALAAEATPHWAVIGIFLILLVAALAYARAFLMPVALAFMLTFVFSPMRRFMERVGIPSGLSALAIVGALLALLGVGGAMLAGPAAQWIESAPTIGRQLDLKLREVRDAAEGVRQAAEQVDEIAKGDSGTPAQKVVVEQDGITTRLAASAPAILAQVGLTLVLLYFVLASGDMIYEKIVYVLPSFRDKRRAIRIARDIERRVSRYLFTITVINAGLGIGIGLAMWALGMPEPALFAVIAFLLNYIPFIGAIAGTALATIIGLVSLPHASEAFLAGGAYLALTSVEGQFITPYWVGRSLQLNTVVVFLSVTLWAWLWSVVGMIVATPLLVSFRVLCEHIPMLENVGHFLSARGAEQADRENGDSA
jgi:predicted PurR-regulated permease PerM